jgi:hypothetical protein
MLPHVGRGDQQLDRAHSPNEQGAARAQRLSMARIIALRQQWIMMLQNGSLLIG